MATQIVIPIVASLLLLHGRVLGAVITNSDSEQDLILTPLIKAGDISSARAQAEDSTKLLSIGFDVKSYSGYFTVSEQYNSKLFFWFFPAQNNPENAPVILWINEMPGFASLKGIFVETGPFKIDERNVLRERNNSWTKSYSMLYIDAPVGTGFSFADDARAYANSSDEEAKEISEALNQFFILFKEFQPNEFYLAGENYAATTMVYVVKHIERDNERRETKINLKGIIVGSPYLDIQQDFDRGEALYNFGLIDEEQKTQFDGTMLQAVKMIQEGKITEGAEIGWSTVQGPDNLFEKTTGFKEVRSALRTEPPSDESRFRKFIDSKQAHKYLHVGLHKFVDIDLDVTNRFAKELAGAHVDLFQQILDKGYRTLIYAAQFDTLVSERSIQKIIQKMKWRGSEEYAKASRKIWKVNGEVAGYIKTAQNLTYAMVRNAGNYAFRDQPDWILDLTEKFFNKEF